MPQLEKLLSGNDLRSPGKTNSVISRVKNQKDFDELFHCLFDGHRATVMRAADAIEKITVTKPSYLQKHKREIIGLCHEAKHKELKWHLALLIPRLSLNAMELDDTWIVLKRWAMDTTESRIVRVNSLQAIFELAAKHPYRMDEVTEVFAAVKKETIPSINARIRIIKRINRSKRNLRVGH